MGEELVVTIRNAMFDGNYRPPIHVARRIAALMVNEKAEYTDVNHTPQDKSMKGVGVVLTATRVIYANWSTPNDHHGRTGTAVVTTWARKTLIKAEIKAGDTNADQDWSQASGSEWPHGGALNLEYEEFRVRSSCLSARMREPEAGSLSLSLSYLATLAASCRTAAKYSSRADRGRPRATRTEPLTSTKTAVDLPAESSHRRGHWFDPSIAHCRSEARNHSGSGPLPLPYSSKVQPHLSSRGFRSAAVALSVSTRRRPRCRSPS
ncbi:hypothetical protein SAMN04488074_13128 [Lentzea albidocapillata subsp. violacea]|uniref:Uncharacterized protein n=1 Tax=Lentzea albidocapillata subsp. violacea TaxID=128104 RepID=A0A1G9XTS7_9PSEU|nr:hypothetical protein SAMN04488074_13128 [Lentzea albidocapillata subsp. violacea]